MKILNTIFISLLAGTVSAQVGIGTTSPSNPLDIEADDAAIDINNDNAGDGDPVLNFQIDGGAEFSIGVDDSDDDKLKIATDATFGTTAVTIDASQNVGIGTSTPGDKLDVNGDIRVTGVGNEIVLETDGGVFSNTIEVINLYETLIQCGRGGMSFLVLGHDNIRMGDGSTTDIANSDFVLDNDGDLSLGTGATSGYKLHIADNNDAAPTTFNMENDDTTIDDEQLVNSITFETNDASANGAGISGRIAQVAENAGNQYGLAFYTYNTSLSESMRITNSGRVGIGTANPTQQLHVAGNICYTGSSASCSDVRYKKDFGKIGGALDKISKIDGYTYNFRVDEFPENDFDSTRQVGFKAQEIQAVLPQVVLENDSGYLSVDYGKVTPLLLMAIKEQQAIIEAQNKEIETQKAELDSKTSNNAEEIEALKAQMQQLLQLIQEEESASVGE